MHRAAYSSPAAAARRNFLPLLPLARQQGIRRPGTCFASVSVSADARRGAVVALAAATTLTPPPRPASQRMMSTHGRPLLIHAGPEGVGVPARPWRRRRRWFSSSSRSPASSADAQSTSDDDDDDDPRRPSSVVQHLQLQIELGNLLPDQAQLRAARKLDRLAGALSGYDAAAVAAGYEADSDREFTRRRRERAEQEREAMRGAHTEHGADSHENDRQEWEDENEDLPPPPPPSRPPVPRGLYLHGSVGTGKSMLMDAFHSLSPHPSGLSIPPDRRRRIHFHEFMSDVHRRCHDLRQSDLKEKGRAFEREGRRGLQRGSLSVDPAGGSADDDGPDSDPIARAAATLASEVSLLCLDEFHVTDVADALILRRLFGVLWSRGVVLVATGNGAPQSLYEGGLNRSYFEPFVGMLERQCVVVDMAAQEAAVDGEGDNSAEEGGRDYRTLLSKGTEEFYFIQSELDTTISRGVVDGGGGCRATDLFRSLLPEPSSSLSVVSVSLPVPPFSRTLLVPRASPCHTAALFNFDELCGTELGANEYRALAGRFKAVVVRDVPRLRIDAERREKAGADLLTETKKKKKGNGGGSRRGAADNLDRIRRFVTLVDELYEGGTALALGAAAGREDLFRSSSSLATGTSSPAASTGGIATEPGQVLGIDIAPGVKGGVTPGASASVRELRMAVRRAESRIAEMCSTERWRGVLLDGRK